jgi:hypothetical protein
VVSNIQAMPDTLDAVGIFLLLVLPGATYVWAFEREVGRWGITLVDRTLRFGVFSTVFLAVFAFPIQYVLISALGDPPQGGEAVSLPDRLLSGERLDWWLYLVPVLYVGIPLAAGLAVGQGVRAGKKWAFRIAGRGPAPRAWDYLFGRGPSGVIRARLKDGSWIGGYFGPDHMPLVIQSRAIYS